jgi:BlaI family transcriptional regulator, penicillinase repressor
MASEQLSDLQLALMVALWELAEATVGGVQAHLERGGRPLAPTTVATLLRRLEAQGWVKHRQQGRQFLYRAASSRDEVTGGVLERVTRSLFGGDATALVSHLLDSGSLRKRDLGAIRALIEQKEGKLK